MRTTKSKCARAGLAAALFAVMAMGSGEVAAPGGAPLPPEIEDPGVIHQGAEPYHATLMPYGSLDEALNAKRHDSSYCTSLNGQWKFYWVKTPAERPVGFFQPEFDVGGWKDIAVPSCWQLQGYGTPYYRNFGYTFQRDYPRVMTDPPKTYTAYDERNPVGSYRREFDVPANFSGRRTFLSFDGVDSAFFVWVNGQKVGYWANSRNTAEFDVTKYLRPGKNVLAVEVYRYNALSYIEDQDMWRLSGIFRNVTLWSAPSAHVRDFFVKPTLDSTYTDGRVTVEAKVKNYGDAPLPAGKVGVTLFGADRRPLENARGSADVPALAPGEERLVTVAFDVPRPAKWTAETPNLYTAVITLGDEILSQKIGFRSIEVRDRVFTINGVPVKLKGANRHENYPDVGHAITEASMVRDLELLKQGNCNHVRTCHYSDDPRWYELCDEYGIYLVAEANIECHGYMGVLDREPMYTRAFVERNEANVETFKNHPSVVIWSMGNECGPGSNLAECVKAVHALDPSRPTHYEGFGIGDDRNPADVDSQMYPSVASIGRIAGDPKFTKPYYVCEYAHAMFNSMGSLGDYVDAFEKYPQVIGGAIWEWEDQGIYNRRDPNHPITAYGGGFGEFPNDHYFIHKGVVASDRSPKPHYPEMKRVYQWVKVEPVDLAAGKVRITNKYAFKDLSDLNGAWALSADGATVASGKLPKLDVGPGKTAEITLDGLAGARTPPGAEAYLRLSFTLAQEQRWAPAGFELAAAQLAMPITPATASAEPPRGELTFSDAADAVKVNGKDFALAFDRKTGEISSLVSQGKELLIPGGGPELHLWRAPHRNDDMWAANTWFRSGLDHLERRPQPATVAKLPDGSVRIESVVDLVGKARFVATHAANYTVYPDGTVAVDNAVICQGRKIPLARMGVRVQLKGDLNQFAYFGRGPMENYSDRKRGSDVGLYASSVKENVTPYEKPMECGNHEDVAWAAVRGSGMPTLMVMSDGDPLQVSVNDHTDEQMTPVEYKIDLPPSPGTIMTVAYRTLGVGSAGCGPRPLQQYQVTSSDPANFSYVLKLLPESETNLAAASHERFALPADRVKPKPKPMVLPVTSPHGQVIEADSFEPREGELRYLTDGDINTYWHSRWSQNEAPMPHHVTVDYGTSLTLKGVNYVARVEGNEGHVKDYELYLSDSPDKWGQPIAKGRFPKNEPEVMINFPPTKARYLRFVALSEQEGRRVTSIAELEAVEAK